MEAISNKRKLSKTKIYKIENSPKKVTKIPKKGVGKAKKRTGPDLYSPEYLSKKHGIKIVNTPKISNKSVKPNKKIGLGFYNSLIIFVVFVNYNFKTAIFLSRLNYI